MIMLTNLDKYKNYKGVGERPKDFDKIWNQGKRKVDEIGFDYELQKVSEPSNIVDFYHLYFYRFLFQTSNFYKLLAIL